MKVRISGVVKESIVDGPGIRFVVFAQGCKHGCPGCHNPQTHDFNGGNFVEADSIVEKILNTSNIDGVTFSGGDPFFQAEEFEYIAKKLKKKNLHILAYTGYLYEQIVRDEKMKKLLENVDVLVDGPFVKEAKTYKLAFRGSKNQRIINVNASIKKNQVITIDY
jgi:anaerobic ribonucleoside-triphosphate reductase activating protein